MACDFQSCKPLCQLQTASPETGKPGVTARNGPNADTPRDPFLDRFPQAMRTSAASAATDTENPTGPDATFPQLVRVSMAADLMAG